MWNGAIVLSIEQPKVWCNQSIRAILHVPLHANQYFESGYFNSIANSSQRRQHVTHCMIIIHTYIHEYRIHRRRPQLASVEQLSLYCTEWRGQGYLGHVPIFGIAGSSRTFAGGWAQRPHAFTMILCEHRVSLVNRIWNVASIRNSAAQSVESYQFT